MTIFDYFTPAEFGSQALRKQTEVRKKGEKRKGAGGKEKEEEEERRRRRRIPAKYKPQFGSPSEQIQW